MTTPNSTALTLSLIIPTRERASYLGHAIRTCIANRSNDFEILVLDNASNDNTAAVVAAISDRRLHYLRNEVRLSMRDNFEKGIVQSKGDIICFIGDDDGLMPGAIDTALAIFESLEVDALSGARAHYFWPDLVASRRGTALLPRHRGFSVKDSKAELFHLLKHSDYYRLPCLYHGFVRRSVVQRISARQGRFFLSSQVDMFSSISLSMEGIRYAFSEAPLIINGASSRSNGASHFGGGTSTEKSLWKKEDDLGFLPGFENSLTVGALIVESGLRYVHANQLKGTETLFEPTDVAKALAIEAAARLAAGQSPEQAQQTFVATRLDPSSRPAPDRRYVLVINKFGRMIRSFLGSMPVNMADKGIVDVFAASHYLNKIVESRSTGLLNGLLEQVKIALKISRNDHRA